MTQRVIAGNSVLIPSDLRRDEDVEDILTRFAADFFFRIDRRALVAVVLDDIQFLGRVASVGTPCSHRLRDRLRTDNRLKDFDGFDAVRLHLLFCFSREANLSAEH